MSGNKFDSENFSEAITNQSSDNGTTDDYTFIQETIRPKKKTKLKKLVFTIALGASFGVVACFTFCAFYPLFSDILGVKEDKVNIENKNPISLGNATQTPSALPTDTPTPTPTPKETTEPKTSKEPVEATPSTKAVDEYYANMLSQIHVIRTMVKQSLVTVNGVTTGTDILDNPDEESNYTSGIIIQKDKEKLLIMTDSSSVDGASYIKISFSDTTVCDGQLYGVNKQIGIALISVAIADVDSRILESIGVAEFGDSAAIKIGDTVIAMGNPNGYMDSIDYGIISNQQHDAYITDAKVQLINTTVEKNARGNGFIFDRKGRILGVITHKEGFVSDYNANLNTCLSISSIRPMLQKMIDKESSLYFGLVASDISSLTASKLGVKQGIYITKVEEASPAFVAGVKKGDVLIQVNGEQITSVMQYYNILNTLVSDTPVQIMVLRKQEKDWAKQTVSATIIKAK